MELLKNMSKMLKELTLDESKPTLAILGSKDGGGKLMVATTENSIASERYGHQMNLYQTDLD